MTLRKTYYNYFLCTLLSLPFSRVDPQKAIIRLKSADLNANRLSSVVNNSNTWQKGLYSESLGLDGQQEGLKLPHP